MDVSVGLAVAVEVKLLVVTGTNVSVTVTGLAGTLLLHAAKIRRKLHTNSLRNIKPRQNANSITVARPLRVIRLCVREVG